MHLLGTLQLALIAGLFSAAWKNVSIVPPPSVFEPFGADHRNTVAIFRDPDRPDPDGFLAKVFGSM